MEKPEEMFWPAQYTEYNIEEKIVIMLENVLENFFFFTIMIIYVYFTNILTKK